MGIRHRACERVVVLAAFVALIVLVTSACSSAPPPSPAVSQLPAQSAPSSASAVVPSNSLETQQPGLRWQYADMTQPIDVMTVPSLPPGYDCHPCHYAAEN